ncbi:MAG TPA: hypothetical protein VM890_03405 [Longimicrobium sp.]|jgi:hypothetical protein|nr:hypothetical protein [Longimicrobium sp.]
MTAIFFNVRSDTAPARRQALLEELRRHPKISSAAALRPGARSESIQRMFYANLADDADVTAVLRDLERRPEVESASLPTERHLVGGA